MSTLFVLNNPSSRQLLVAAKALRQITQKKNSISHCLSFFLSHSDERRAMV